MPERLLSKKEVVELVGFSYPTIWSWMWLGEFPRSIVLGRGQAARVAWKASEIEEWIGNRPRSQLKGDPVPEPERRPRRRLRGDERT